MEYQATYRRSEIAIPALLGVLAFMGVGITVAIRTYDYNDSLSSFLWVIGISLGAIVAIFVNSFRVHSWTILPDGLQVAERPKVPLAGLRRRATIPYAEIAAIHRIESGFDRVMDIVTRDGRRYRLTQAMKGDGGGIPRPDPDRDLYTFADTIVAAGRAAGVMLPAPSEGLSFWNAFVGLLLQVVMLVVALAIAAATLWALLDGGLPVGNRTGYGAAIFILLPFGAGYMLLKSLRRRRLVLAGRSA